MIKTFSDLFCCLAMALLLFSTSCSVDPVSGTDTGNPDITACLNAASRLLDTSGMWIPSMYLTGGEQQLNPERITRQWKNQTIAKRMQSYTNTSAYIIVVRIDTVFVIDTQIVNDTIIVDTAVTDTVLSGPVSAVDTSLLIVRYMRHDTAFVRDTMIAIDTMLLQRNDTILFRDNRCDTTSASESKAVTINTSQTGFQVKGAYTVVRDSTGNIIILQAGGASQDYTTVIPATQISSGVSYNMVSLKTTAGGKTVTESYQYSPSGIMQALNGAQEVEIENAVSRGIITCADAFSTETLEIDFDAGGDRQFETTGDNRICSLQRRTSRSNVLVDQVRYGRLHFGTLEDTVFLQRDQVAVNDSIDGQVTKYRCVCGADSNDHRQNRLVNVERNIRFTKGSITTAHLSLTPEIPLAIGELPAIGTMQCTVDYGKGLTGRIDAIVNYSGKTITGIYAKAGIEYRFIYSMINKKTEITSPE